MVDVRTVTDGAMRSEEVSGRAPKSTFGQKPKRVPGKPISTERRMNGAAGAVRSAARELLSNDNCRRR